MNDNLVWHKVLEDKATLPEGRVTTVYAGHKTICLTHYKGVYSALDNHCPHMGGPLGEGSIEEGLLRCPWHGWDFNPTGGKSEGFDDGTIPYPVKIEGKELFVGLEKEEPHVKTIPDLMVETMVNWGVDRVFGMVGHSNLGLSDSIRRQAKAGKLKYIGIRHEGAAAFAASAYGKLTGKPSATLTIAGPGSTNLYTGLWDAKVDRAPVIALTGQVSTQVVGTGNFQELDLIAAFNTVAAFNQRVGERSQHSELMTLAVKSALLNRDVSHLTFPDDIQTIAAPENAVAQTPEGRITPLQISPPEESYQKALKLIQESENPAIVVGHGARFHMEMITKLAEHLQCPVMTTFKGKGQISDSHPLGCGVLGRSGTPVSTYFMNNSDLLIVIGASFSKHTGITPKIKTIQIDFDPLALSKFHKIDTPLWGEISVTVKKFLDDKDKISKKENKEKIIAHRWSIWRAEKESRLMDDQSHGLSSISVFDQLTKQAPENAVMCVDVGNNAYSFGRYFESKNHNFLLSGYLGSIGFALPAAIGAWAAVGDTRPIIAVAGDGGICQYLAEITTLVKHHMPVKVIVLNNNELGKISKEQRTSSFDVWQTSLVNPNFAEYATGCGALGIRVDKMEDLNDSMFQLLDHDGPALMEVMINVNLI